MRKKLFAILMSAMMMVTFMPAMAFASTVTVPAKAELLSVSTPYDTLKVSVTTAENGPQEETIAVDRVFNDDGTITAKVASADAALRAKVENNPVKNPDFAKMQEVLTKTDVTFYDFAGATLVKNDGSAMYQSFTREQIGTLFNESCLQSWKIKVVEPSYAKGYNAASPKSEAVSFNDAKLKLTGYDADVAEKQNCTLVAYFPTVPSTPILNNAGLSTAVVVGADTVGTAEAAKFFVDKTTAFNGYNYTAASSDANPCVVSNDYDGAAHKLVMKAGVGVTATYAKYNAKTSSWEAVDEIAWKDAADETLYKAVVTDSAKSIKTFYFKVSVAQADITFALSSSAKVLYTGDTCDAFDFVVLDGANDDEDKAAVADKEAIVNFLKAYYDAKATATNTGYAISLVEKTLTPAEQKAKTAAEEKANWKLTVGEGGLTASVAVVRNTKVNDITVTSLNKTVHVKKAKATKKAYTKTVMAETLAGTAKFKKLSGNSKIEVAADGKITIKKGLKKGTYKVKVKAYVPEGKGYLYAATTEVVKVKVVK